MSAPPNPSLVEQVAAARYALLAGTFRGLGLEQRMPELMRRRRWPADDVDLSAVLSKAVVCVKLGALGERIRRPDGADALGGLWPFYDKSMTASKIVELMELQELLEQR